MSQKGIFKEEDILRELADRMEIDVEGFNPFYNVEDDYKVLLWMRTTVRMEYVDTWKTFASYVSGAMHQYEVGDYVRNAILAIGIVTPSK
jgi:hypothetical protein